MFKLSQILRYDNFLILALNVQNGKAELSQYIYIYIFQAKSKNPIKIPNEEYFNQSKQNCYFPHDWNVLGMFYE